MFRIFSLVAALALFLGLQKDAHAFSLYGQTDSRWQDGQLAYDTWGGELGGPMNLGEEYRLTTPVLTYGFDKTFLDYFGEDGVEAIEKAMAILNGIPAASAMSDDLSEFPLAAKRMNLQAAALLAIDIKTYALSSVLVHMGVGASPRWVWTIQDASPVPNTDPVIWEFSIVMRNFDPFTWAHSPYINEVLWTYQTVEVLPDTFDAVDFPVDVNMGALRLPLSYVNGQGYTAGLLPGEYYTGLTRDDAAALKYLYSPRNLNAEILPVGATNTTGPVFSGGVGGTGSPWGPPTGTGGGGVGSPFSSPFIGLTNIFTNITFTNITGGAGIALIDGAVRAGIDKVVFQRMDAPLGGIYTAVTNRWLDVFFTNFGPSIVMVQQPVERVIARPDILFGADNLPLLDGQDPAFFAHTVGWNNNVALNTQTSPTNPGPGTILTPFDLVFSNAGPHLYNLDQEPIGGADGTEASGSIQVIWGSFDGSSRPPVLFPRSMSIQAAEARVLGLSTTP